MKKCITMLSLGLGTISSFSVHANTNYKDGLQFGSQDDPYWFKVNGALMLDERLFFGKKQGNLHSGAYIKKFDVDLSGGLGKDLSFTTGVGFKAHHSKVEVNDAYITYSGFKWLGENFNVSVGKVNPSFCLESTSSSKWTPFLERSIATTAFSPDPGLGISVSKWQKDYSISVTLTQPKPTDKTNDENGKEVKHSDRLQLNTRLTKAHFFGDHKFLQLGFSGHIKDDGHNGIKFSTGPEANSRHSTDTLLNTTVNNKNIKAKNHYTIGLELLGQDGPLSGQAEGLLTKVKRDKSQLSYNNPNQPGQNLTFKGYYANINYVLTGESRIFKECLGILGQVIPNKESGAWEVSGRYSFLNLNDKDVVGGTDHSIGAAVTWYANKNIAVTGEYLKHHLKRNGTLAKLNFDSVGARLQFVF
jgi:phosphate-selective porin OprO/OprP